MKIKIKIPFGTLKFDESKTGAGPELHLTTQQAKNIIAILQQKLDMIQKEPNDELKATNKTIVWRLLL